MVSLTALVAALACQSPALPVNLDLGPRLGAATLERPASLRRDFFSGLPDATRLVIADQERWAALWDRVTSHLEPQPELPAVDFQTHRVLVAAMGSRPSSGYQVAVDSVVEFEQGTIAFVTGQSPGDDCGVATVITAPVDVVLVPITRAPVTFENRDRVHRCS